MKDSDDTDKSELKNEKIDKTVFTQDQIITLAINNHVNGNIAEAIKFYSISINQGFANDIVLANYGLILQDAGNLKDAELFTLKAIELNPNFAAAYSNLGGILRDQGKLKDAEKYTHKSIELDPDFVHSRSNMASILRDLGKLDEAEISARKAIELNPDFGDAYYNLGCLLYTSPSPRDDCPSRMPSSA